MSNKNSARRFAALLSVGAMAVTGVTAIAAPAGAVVTAGPDRADGLPQYFRDAAGLAAGPCEDAVVCEGGFDPADGVYFDAGAEVGAISAIYSVGAGLDPDAGGALAIDNVARFTATGIPNGTYTIRDPWTGNRPRTCTVAANRMDCRVVTGNPVKSLLRANNAPNGFLGDGELASRVTGSPSGFNRILITGPNRFRQSQSLFTVLGQMPAGTAMTSVGVQSLRLGSITKSTPSMANIPVSSFGTADATLTVTKGGANPAAFQVQNPAAVASGGAVNVRVTYTPRANRDVSATLTIDDNGLAAPRQVLLTGIAHDTRAPRLVARTPDRGATVGSGISVKVRFSEAVRGVNGNLTLVDRTGDRVGARVSRKRGTYVINPRQALDRASRYTVMLNGGAQAIRDLAGNATRDMSWSFRTR
jgi:hypothetical protein